MLVNRSLPRLSCLQCVLPNCPDSKMPKWVKRGQCQGRLGRSTSNARQRPESPVFRPISRQWQERQCQKLRLPFVRAIALARPRPSPLLRNREPSAVYEIGGDGNCLFRCLSLVITGTESHHNLVRQRIVNHISANCKAFSALIPESPGNENEHAEACARYLSTSKMADGSTWGSDVEILAAAHLLRTRIFVYTMHGPAWQWVEHGMELTDPNRKPYKDSIYLMHTGLVHYDLVEEVEPTQSEAGGKQAIQTPSAFAQQNCRRSIEKVQRRRGFSVPCARVSRQSNTRRRSNSRSSRNSSISSCSRSSSSSGSVDTYLSCEESVSSSVSRTNVRHSTSIKRRRPSVATSNAKLGVFRPSSSFVYRNNNCSSRKIACTSRKTNLTAIAANRNDCGRDYRLNKSIQRDPSSASLYKPLRYCRGTNMGNKDSHLHVPGIHKFTAQRYKLEKKVRVASCSTNRATNRAESTTVYKQKTRDA